MLVKHYFIIKTFLSFPLIDRKDFLLSERAIIKLTFLVLFFSITSIVAADALTRVCEADGTTLFDGRDIMVGTNLTIIVDSNIGEYWAGDLAITDDDRNYGLLSARDYNDITGNYDGSCLEAAGEEAVVWEWLETGIAGFNFQTDMDDEDVEAGDWFIVDYNAIDIGDCNVGFYENFAMDPTYELPFTHVRTRDLNNDTIVNLVDYGIFASYWQETGCTDPNWCEGADLDTNGIVDGNDLELFVRYWLETTR